MNDHRYQHLQAILERLKLTRVPERLDQLLRLVLVTPAMHKVHHSRLPAETDSNYTSLLSVWDRLFGSFRLRRELHDIRFGLEGFDRVADQTVAGLLRTPLARTNGSDPGLPANTTGENAL